MNGHPLIHPGFASVLISVICCSSLFSQEIIPRKKKDVFGIPQPPAPSVLHERNGSADDNSQRSADATSGTWFRVLMDGKPAGLERIDFREDSTPDDKHHQPAGTRPARNDSNFDQRQVFRRRESWFSFRRDGRDQTVHSILETKEFLDGTLQQWTFFQRDSADALTEQTGAWSSLKSAYEITQSGRGAEHRVTLPSHSPVRSPIITGWARPVTMGTQSVQTKVLFPETLSMQDLMIQRRSITSSPAETTIPGDSSPDQHDPFSVQYWTKADPGLRTEIRFDRSGQVMSTSQPLMGGVLTAERTTPERAVVCVSLSQINRELQRHTPAQNVIPDPGNRSTLRLQVTRRSEFPLEIPESDFQTCQQIAENEVILTLRNPDGFISEDPQFHQAALSGNRTDSRKRRRISELYLKDSSWINGNSYPVQRLAEQAAVRTENPLDICIQLTKHLKTSLATKPFTPELSTAESVAKSMRGNWIDRSVLLCSMFRSRKIPSRIAAGIVYSEKTASFYSHMWTEVFLDGTWMPFDPMPGSDRIGTTHIKIADSTLPGTDSASAAVILMSVADILNQCSFRILTD